MSSWISQGILKGATGATGSTGPAGTTLWSGLTGTPPALSVFSGNLPESQITNLTTDLAAKAPTSRLITAGTGLSGGGDLSADRTLAVDGTVGRTGGTAHYYDYDDFLGAVPKFVNISNSGGTGAVSALSVSNSGVAHQGVVQLAAGTVASNFARIYANAVYLQTGATLIWRAIVNPSTVAGAEQFFVGFSDQPGATIDISHNYIGFLFQASGNANWSQYVRAVGSVTQHNSSVSASAAWADLKIVAVPGSIAFYINGTLVDTITTTIPASTVALSPCVFLSNGSVTTNYYAFVDMVEIDIDSTYSGKFTKALI